MAHTGLYFGSFNPIHIGHLILAQYMLNTGKFDKIRFVVSPQNPFKSESDLFDEKLRLAMVRAAVSDNPGFDVSDAEFQLSKPSYTIQTLRHFQENEPEQIFSIIMGSDNLEKLRYWKEIEAIAERCDFHIYSRRGSENTLPDLPVTIHKYVAPFLDISATFIRREMQSGNSVKYMLPDSVISILKDAKIIQ